MIAYPSSAAVHASFVGASTAHVLAEVAQPVWASQAVGVGGGEESVRADQRCAHLVFVHLDGQS